MQIPVDDECSKILAFNTHHRIYKFNRLPFGIKVAPRNFPTSYGCDAWKFDFAITYLDDILIKSETREHIEHIREVKKKKRIKKNSFLLQIKWRKMQTIYEENKMWVLFNSTSTSVDHLMPRKVRLVLSSMWVLELRLGVFMMFGQILVKIFFENSKHSSLDCWVLWHIHPCRSLNAKFHLYKY